MLLFVLEILKKKKKSSENDQLTGHFQSFFFLFFVHPTLNLKKKSCKSTNKKKFLALLLNSISAYKKESDGEKFEAS